MKTIKPILFSIIGFSFFACGDRNNVHDLDQPGEILEIQKKIIEAAGDVPVYEIVMRSQGELETSLDYVRVVTENDENSVKETDYRIIGSLEPTTEIEDNAHFVKNHLESDPKKIGDIDFKLVESNFEKAKEIIPAQFIDHSLYSYTIKFDNNKRADRFTVNTLMEGESDHMEGRNIVTNYYEFIFNMNEDGELEVEE